MKNSTLNLVRSGLWVFGVLVLLGGCKDNAPPPPANPAAAPQTGELNPARARAAITISDGAGALVYTLEPSDNGYRLKDASNAKVGKVKIQADRVKVKDTGGATLAKVKRKDGGFKLSVNDATVFKAKVKPNKIKLKRPDGSEFAVLHGSGATVAGQEIKTLSGGETNSWRVERAGKAAGVVTGVSQSAAVYLGLTSLTLQQRIAVMVYVNENR